LAIRPNTADDRLMSMSMWSIPLGIACAVVTVWVILAVMVGHQSPTP